VKKKDLGDRRKRRRGRHPVGGEPREDESLLKKRKKGGKKQIRELRQRKKDPPQKKYIKGEVFSAFGKEATGEPKEENYNKKKGERIVRHKEPKRNIEGR